MSLNLRLNLRDGKMKAFLLTVSSVALTAGVIANSYVQKKQFYPSVVYITKSSPSMAILYLQAFVLVFLMGKMMRKVFFGQLRAAEMEHLIERSWYAVTETCLAFTVFRDDFSPRFVALFTLLLFLKCFHWLAEDRIDYMERSPIISWLFHLRAIGLLLLLCVVDLYFINHAYYSTLIKGPSVQLVFGFEYAILLTIVVHIFVKYLLHSVDLRSENPWENKAVYLLYTELVLGFLKAVLYMMFLAIMTKVHTFPLFAIRPMYLTVRAFKKAVNDVLMSRRAIRNMNTLYPDATPEDLAQTDNVCIICREEMAQGCKKLPCNHIFHTSCLRSWFQRQQTCPTCRMNVLDPLPHQARQPPQPHQPPQPQQPQQPQPPPAQGMFPGMFGWPPAAAPPVQPAATPNAQQQATSTATSATPSALPSPSNTDNSFFNSGSGMMMPPFMPPFMMPMNFGMPFPSPSLDMSGLTEDELREMEGTERKAVEARIQCLDNIKTLLDAAVMQMQQYSSIVNNAQSNSTSRVYSMPTQKTTTKVSETSTDNFMSASPQATLSETSTTAIKESSNSSQNHTHNGPDTEDLDLEGAVGFSIADSIPQDVTDWANKEENEDAKEMRRRRLERFSSNTSDTSTGSLTDSNKKTQ